MILLCRNLDANNQKFNGLFLICSNQRGLFPKLIDAIFSLSFGRNSRKEGSGEQLKIG